MNYKCKKNILKIIGCFPDYACNLKPIKNIRNFPEEGYENLHFFGLLI